MSIEPTDGGALAGSVPLRQKSGIFTYLPESIQQSPCYPTPSKALKFILDIRYQYAIVVSLGWPDYSCPVKHVPPSSDPSNSTKIFPSQSITLSPTLRLRKSFNCNTYADPRKCCKQKTYGNAKSFSCNTYQKQQSPSVTIQSASMTPHETGTFFTGGNFDNNIGPVNGYPTSSMNTAPDGTFHDVPFGKCSPTPINTPLIATQTITMIVPSGTAYQVRSQSFSLSAPNATSFG